MSSNDRTTKIYGAIETSGHITFSGFCKRIYDIQQQKINIFIDGNKIDTIIADKHIEEIEDKYEVFDTNGFCFEYKVPSEYIGIKHKIEFITEDNNQLLNSPSFTVDKTSPKYTEYTFLESLKEIDIKKLENLYKNNCITTMFHKELIEDENFCNYIKDLTKHFSNTTINFVSFNENEKKLIRNIFKNQIEQINILSPSSVYELAQNSEVFLYTHIDQVDLYYKLLKYSNEIVSIDIRFRKKFIKDYDIIGENHEIFTNPTKYNINQEIIEKYNHSFNRVVFERAYHETIDDQYTIDIEKDGIEFNFFERINLILKDEKLKRFLIKNFFKILRS